ncbi:MAG: hypothetical protein SFX74_07945 [Fimbriimonadaceae bacterium]|nr:hypothetical protein [Fimbriimonadaceae bacterium]
MEGRIAALGLGLLAVVAGLAGCRSGSSGPRMPVGQVWVYRVVAPPMRYVEEVKAVQPVAVFDAPGVEFRSGLGNSRVAWKDGELFASQLNQTRFVPPIAVSATAAKRHHGRVEAYGKVTPFSARILPEKDPVDVQVDQTTLKARKTVIQGRMGDRNLEIHTYVHSSKGIVRQEEWINDRLTLRLELVAMRDPSGNPIP